MRTPEDIVRAEVLVCVSSLVSTLAAGAEECADKDLNGLCEQAMELAAPIDDWAEAAIDAGWKKTTSGFVDDGNTFEADAKQPIIAGSWQELCEAYGIDPYQREVFEHWAVTEWFADQLRAQGEKVDKDFAGLCVWARTTTGQSIYIDSVVEKIAVEINARH